MIQRIQSVYLLLVTILLVVAICMPVGQFIGADGVTAHVFKPLGVAFGRRRISVYLGLVRDIVAQCTCCLLYDIPFP